MCALFDIINISSTCIRSRKKNIYTSIIRYKHRLLLAYLRTI